jgi:hypothetical protein
LKGVRACCTAFAANSLATNCTSSTKCAKRCSTRWEQTKCRAFDTLLASPGSAAACSQYFAWSMVSLASVVPTPPGGGWVLDRAQASPHVSYLLTGPRNLTTPHSWRARLATPTLGPLWDWSKTGRRRRRDGACALGGSLRRMRICPPQAVPSTEPRATTVSNTIPTGRVDAAPLCSSHPPLPGVSSEPVGSNADSEGQGASAAAYGVTSSEWSPFTIRLRSTSPVASQSQHRVDCAPTGADERRSRHSAGRILRRAEQPQRGGPQFPVTRSPQAAALVR